MTRSITIPIYYSIHIENGAQHNKQMQADPAKAGQLRFERYVTITNYE